MRSFFIRLWMRISRRRRVLRNELSIESEFQQIEKRVAVTLESLASIDNDLQLLKVRARAVELDKQRILDENEGLNSKIGILEKITMPTLISMHQQVLSRVEADIAANMKQQGLNS